VALTSGLVVAGWGYFLWQGIKDPLGGINSLWPLFGIANQLLAIVALAVATTIIVKLGRVRYAWVTLVPLAWLASVTFTAAYQKVFSPNVRIGFLAHARMLEQQASLQSQRAGEMTRLIANDRLDAVVTALLIALVVLVLLEAAAEWIRVLAGRKAAVVQESPFVLSRMAKEESA
jgi:carbon starvation protein